MSSTLCDKCFKKIDQQNFVTCNVCKCKYHRICAKLDDVNIVIALEQCKYIVYNCENCLSTASDLVSNVSLLSKEIKELKILISRLLTNSNNNCLLADELKQKEKQQSYAPSTLHSSNSSSKVLVDAVLPNNRSAVVFDAASLHQYTSKGKMDIHHPLTVVSNNVDDESDILSTVNPESLPSNTDWVNVRRRKKPKKVICVGDNSNDELDVVVKKKWVHLSSFKPSVSEDNIVKYVSNHLKIGKEHLECYKLVKKDTSLENLKFVNFKLGISSNFYNDLLNPSLWTSNIRIRPFKFFRPPIAQNRIQN